MERTAIQKIFDMGFDEFKAIYPLSHEQLKAASAIMNCRTEKLGYNYSVCDYCGAAEIHYNSCRNRHCPVCQVVNKEIWVESRKAEAMNMQYFHVVMTIPDTYLNPFFLCNQKILYGALLECANETILQLSAETKFLGAKPAITGMLHTWGSDMRFHPHVHMMVSGGGITTTGQLLYGGKSFFIPIHAVMKVFRGKFLARLRKLYEQNALLIPDSLSQLQDYLPWSNFIAKLYSIDWAPYIKPAFGDGSKVIEYLGRYSNRIAATTNRIISLTDTHVSFTAKDYRNGGSTIVKLTHVEFIRRFLMHVLPSGFRKVRYSGMLSNRYKSRYLNLYVTLSGNLLFRSRFFGLSKIEIVALLWKNYNVCPHCKCGRLRPLGSPQVDSA